MAAEALPSSTSATLAAAQKQQKIHSFSARKSAGRRHIMTHSIGCNFGDFERYRDSAAVQLVARRICHSGSEVNKIIVTNSLAQWTRPVTASHAQPEAQAPSAAPKTVAIVNRGKGWYERAA